MHDLKAIRDNPSAFDRGLTRRGLKPLSAEVLALDEQRREVITKLQVAQARRNAASKDIGKAKAAKDETLSAKLMAEVADLKSLIQAGEDEEKKFDARIKGMLEVLPNAPRDDVPDGADEKGNREVRRIGTPRQFAFKPKQHFELGEALGLMDFETAAKISGARFTVLKGALARMERALGMFMLDLHVTEGGYTEASPPLLVKSEAVFGTGSLPKFSEDLFKVDVEYSMASDEGFIRLLENLQIRNLQQQVDAESPEAIREHVLKQIEEIDDRRKRRSGFWLIPTAEVSLTNFVRDEIVDVAKLPMRLAAWTPCFRSEAGAAGRDTRGMIRQHQFSKVEMVSITTPETSLAEHERMTARAEDILKRLELPFRTMLLCTGDMGFASQKTYDLEVWLPGQDTYREISSCSVCGDFQGRRMNARFRDPETKEVRFVHTLNGSGLAVGRTLIAIMENYQEADGSIRVPEPLQPYMGGLERILAG